MLIVALVVTVIAIVMLAIAIITGNTISGFVVIALAALGLLLLARDWLRERRGRADESLDDRPTEQETDREKRVPDPETFEPDVWDEDADENDLDDELFNVEGDDQTE